MTALPISHPAWHAYAPCVGLTKSSYVTTNGCTMIGRSGQCENTPRPGQPLRAGADMASDSTPAAKRVQRPLKTLEERFWPKVNRSDDDGCWGWKGDRHKFGYGVIWTPEYKLLAHRVSWELHNGPIPDGMMVCHRCDNPPCCNPEHLFLGSQADNMRDMIAKGRGSNPPLRANAKLAINEVQEIRALYATGTVTMRALAEHYGVTPQAVGAVIRRLTWTHIP